MMNKPWHARTTRTSATLAAALAATLALLAAGGGVARAAHAQHTDPRTGSTFNLVSRSLDTQISNNRRRHDGAAHATDRAPLLRRAIAAIRARVAAINARTARARKVERELGGQSAEGGTLAGWFFGRSLENLQKMSATFFGETGQTTDTFYLHAGRPIFVLRTETFYAQPLGAAKGTPRVARRTLRRFYFDPAGRLIQQLNGAKPVSPNTPAAEQSAREILRRADEFARLLRSNKTGRRDASVARPEI